MRKSGNYFSWSIFAVFLQAFFMLLLFIKGIQFTYINVFAFPLIAAFFICMRNYIEWREYIVNQQTGMQEKVLIKDEMASEVRSYIVRNDLFSHLMFAFISAVFLILANFNYVHYSNVIFTAAFISSIVCWFSFNAIRKFDFNGFIKDERITGVSCLMP